MSNPVSNPFEYLSLQLELQSEHLKEIRDQLLKQDAPSSSISIKYITKEQAASIASVSRSTISNWARAGLIKRFYFGKSVRYLKQDLLEYLELQST